MENINVEALTTVINALKGLDLESQKRILQAVSTFFGISVTAADIKDKYTIEGIDLSVPSSDISFSANRQISPKAFLRDKMPTTDVERIACLAYYLTHYRDTPHFKTLDLSTLNTEAAQPKLSNPTYAVDNATKAGLLVQAVKGAKQLSSAGELFVQALPDREAAKTAIANLRSKRRPKKAKNPN